MPRDDYSSVYQAPFAPSHGTKWNSVPSLHMPALQSNALAESAGWPQLLGPAAALSGENPDIMAGVGDYNYPHGFSGLNINSFITAEDPGATRQLGDYIQDFTTHMSSVHPNVMEKLDNTPITNRASSLLGIDPNGPSPSFDGGDPMTQSIANPPSSNNGWTNEQDKLLMRLKAQSLGYSAIQEEMRKKFGWTRNKNVLVKRFAVLKKRYKPQIKTRIVRDISKKITPEIIKAVGKELEKVTSSGSNSIATELEDLVPLRLPEFLERLVADIGVSLHQIVEDDKRSSA
ncbi:uncharacterized protein FFB20_11676 [Fusarium fujikuroi]|uniref:Myb-like domain-containing protein n=1 Tax=Fusarium fujikuroi TaxID=5127 RepID=A0A0I9ZBU4_FUSFU|nr:Uncharacterized protein LW93_14246 [Fusarium fujikuroi]KLP05445.1 Uncharacterized protein Y057_5641 [Fusarium fujikuroi]QGI78422.1 hypothetical protein CEK25_005151 [Fusarium fujikuroi]SCO02710.1 uncharacterized protein FFB20_11676 [Fusarium fujikuroi]SCO03196.1 uncharacterized protein FFC1_09237 [Fusarium fujikuroi]